MPVIRKKIRNKYRFFSFVSFYHSLGTNRRAFWLIYLMNAGLITLVVLFFYLSWPNRQESPNNWVELLRLSIVVWIFGNICSILGASLLAGWPLLPETDPFEQEQDNETPKPDYLKLKRSRDYIRHIFHSINELLIIITPNGIIKSINRSAVQTLGYGKEELIGKSVDIIIVKEATPFSVNWYDEFQKNGRIPYVETEFRTKKGGKIPILFTATAIGGVRKNPELKMNGIVCVGLPIAAEKRAEVATRKSDERYRNFLESIDQAYYEIDLDGQLIFFNNSMCRLLGYSREDLMSRHFSEFTNENQARELNRIFQRVYESGKPDKGFIWEFIHKDGSVRKIGASLSPMNDEKGNPIGFRGVARDITNRLLLEAQLTHAQKLEAIGQLAAGIAHEINTPIQYIQDNTLFLQDAYKQLIKFEETDNLASADENVSNERADDLDQDSDMAYYIEEVPKAIAQSLEGLERVSKIVSAMRVFAHPGGAEKVPIDINKTIEDAITVSRNEWKYIAEMETVFDESLPLVYCLPAEFNQTILNIIINAAHAIASAKPKGAMEKGRITISTRSYGRWAEICIRDTGTGIPEKIQSRIFDPFFTTKEVGEGTGQGLALAHSIIVNKHGGTIRFETEEGQGTRFFICLPLTSA